MGVLAKIGASVTRMFSKSLRPDLDHGGWLDTSWPWNYWQSDYSAKAGLNNVVYSCVQAYAQTIAQLPSEHLRERDDGGYDKLRNTPAYRVLKKPNNYQTRSDFLLNAVYSLLYEGNAYAIAIRNNRGEPVELHLVPPRSVSPMVADGEVFYHMALNEIVGTDTSVLAPARDVLHIKLLTPDDPLRGQTPIYAAAMAINVNNATMGHQAAFFDNMSRPSGILTTDEKLTPEQTQALRDRWEEVSKGIKSGKVPILSWGIKWQSLSLNSVDSQLIEALKFSVKDIARAFRVPLPLIGEEEGASYNNVYNLLSFWKASGLGFVIEHIEQAMTAFFRLPDTEHIELDTDSLLRTDMKGRYEAITKGITGGLLAPNEGRRMEGLPAVEGGDEPRVQQQMVPLNYEPPEPAPAPAPEPEPEGDEEAEEPLTETERAYLIERALMEAMG